MEVFFMCDSFGKLKKFIPSFHHFEKIYGWKMLKIVKYNSEKAFPDTMKGSF